MKNLILIILLNILTSNVISQSCNSLVVTPTTTSTCYNFTAVASGGGSSPCTGGGFGGGGTYRVVQICTDATAQCINVDLTGLPGSSGGTSIALYTSCTGGAFSGYVAGSANCYPAANNAGWSTAGLPLTPNTCYFMAIWTKGTVAAGAQICLKKESPPNDFRCNPAPIGTSPIAYDNYCMTAGSAGDPTPAQFCAGSLENNAWFSFTTSPTCTFPCTVVVTIAGISCSGGGSGFQIGYFTGACNSLTNIGCTSGSGGTVTATINNLNPGQVVTVGIDGNAGAYCSFNISATNVVPLPTETVSFIGYKSNNMNYIEWVIASQKDNDFFTLERSEDGINWKNINIMDGAGTTTELMKYTHIDVDYPSKINYYRLKQTDYNGKSTYSDVISINNKITPKSISKIYNLMGQEVDINCDCLKIIQYVDGTIEKRF